MDQRQFNYRDTCTFSCSFQAFVIFSVLPDPSTIALIIGTSFNSSDTSLYGTFSPLSVSASFEKEICSDKVKP